MVINETKNIIKNKKVEKEVEEFHIFIKIKFI